MKYLKLGYYFTKEIIYYSYLLLARNLWFLMVVFLLYSIVTYGANMKGLTTIGGISISYYVWYVFSTEIVMTNRRDQDIINDIKSGAIIMFLNKPIHYIFYLLSSGFFKNLVKMLIIGSSTGIIIYLSVLNFPWFGFNVIFLYVLSMLIGMGIMALISISMGLIAFAIEDSGFLRFILNKFYLILGGVFFPVDIYPTWLKIIADYLPFKYFIYCPSKFLVTGDINFFNSYFYIQIIWFLILLFLVIFSYNNLVKKLEINGG